MKHLALLTLATLLLASCQKVQPTTDDNVKCIAEFQYKGHDYLVFKEQLNYGQGVVHDPDCRKCLSTFD